jgi:hypothetical protein
MLFLLLWACSEPTTPADCETLSEGATRDACYEKVAPAVFRTSPEAGIALVDQKISDPMLRDFIYLQITREVDPSTPRYCNRIKDKVLADRCMVLVSRPHLHRGLSGQEGPPPGGAPGGAPGGTPPSSNALPGEPVVPKSTP